MLQKLEHKYYKPETTSAATTTRESMVTKYQRLPLSTAASKHCNVACGRKLLKRGAQHNSAATHTYINVVG